MLYQGSVWSSLLNEDHELQFQLEVRVEESRKKVFVGLVHDLALQAILREGSEEMAYQISKVSLVKRNQTSNNCTCMLRNSVQNAASNGTSSCI